MKYYLTTWTLIDSNALIPLSLDKMAADDISVAFLVNKQFHFFIKNSLKFVLEGPFDNNPALVQMVAWRQIGDTH